MNRVLMKSIRLMLNSIKLKCLLSEVTRRVGPETNEVTMSLPLT